MRRRSLGWAVVVSCTYLVVLGGELGAESSPGSEASSSAQPAVCLDQGLWLSASKRPPVGGGPGTLSTCIAQCGQTGSVSCSGSSCSATDRDCNSTPGYCWSNTEGTKYCPPCESSCTATCAAGPDVTCIGSSCSATDSACPSEDGFCWSNAEGYKHCQPCEGPEPCTAETHCGFNPPIFCQGDVCDVRQGCWVECDAFRTYCPGEDETCMEN